MKVYAILGFPVEHSLSPKLHNAVFEALGLDDRKYEFCNTVPEKLREVMDKLRVGEYEGFSVTIPYKKAVIPYLDELTERARKIGAVNTIVRTVGKGGTVRTVGDNTDYLGFERSLMERGIIEHHAVKGFAARNGKGLSFNGRTTNNEHPNELPNRTTKNEVALVLGSGGVARAVIAVLTDHGFKVEVASLRPTEEQQLIDDFEVKVKAYDELDPDDDYQIIVNCTPVGMWEKEKVKSKKEKVLLIDPKWYREDRVYVDVIYNPRVTKFLQLAQEAGAKTITGDRMFLWQAVEQAKYFCELGDEDSSTVLRTGRVREVMEREIR